MVGNLCCCFTFNDKASEANDCGWVSERITYILYTGVVFSEPSVSSKLLSHDLEPLQTVFKQSREQQHFQSVVKWDAATGVVTGGLCSSRRFTKDLNHLIH